MIYIQTVQTTVCNLQAQKAMGKWDFEMAYRAGTKADVILVVVGDTAPNFSAAVFKYSPYRAPVHLGSSLLPPRVSDRYLI